MGVEIQGYTDPRTGEYVRATEANEAEAVEAIGFIMAWKFYWDGPQKTDGEHIYDRATWLDSYRRRTWLDALSLEQRMMLADAPPPEEVPPLLSDGSES